MAEHYVNKDCVCQARQLRRLLDKQIQSCDEAITKLIADDEEIKTKAGRQPCYKGAAGYGAPGAHQIRGVLSSTP